MATSNIVGRAQRYTIVNSPFGTELPLSPLDKPQESPYGAPPIPLGRAQRRATFESLFGN
jgi:hypothetical protein